MLYKSDKPIKIPTSKENFFLEYLIIMKPVLNSIIRKINNGQVLRNKAPELYDMPMRVLAQLLYYHDKFRDQDDEMRSKMVFDYDTKQKIMEHLNISEDGLNSYFSQLRKIRILDGKSINKFFLVPLEGSKVNVIFEFMIDEEPDGKKDN